MEPPKSGGDEAPLCLLFMSPRYGKPQEGMVDVATLDFFPFSRDPQEGRGCVLATF